MGAVVRNAISQAIGDLRYLQLDGSNTASQFNTPYQQTVSVAKSGAEYSLIQDAIDSISDASAIKPYIILIYPGNYVEDITMKAWVSLKGMGDFSEVIISGTNSAPLIDMDAGNSVSTIENLTMSLAPTNTGQIVVQVTNGVKFFIDCDIKLMSSTNGITGRLIDCDGGTITISNTRMVYEMSGTLAGANTHDILHISGTSVYIFKNGCYFDIDVSDAQDVVNVITDTSTTTSDCFILNSYGNIDLLSATFSGTLRFLYVTGSGKRVVQGNHIDVTSAGNGTGGIYVLDNATLEVRSTTNFLSVEGFATNYLGVFLDVASIITSHFDDIVAADLTVGAGVYNFANSPIDEEFWADTVLCNTIYGGTGVGDTIDIYGSTDSSLGSINLFSPIDVRMDSIVPALVNPAYCLRDLYDFTTPGGAVVMGNVQSNKTLTVNTGIWFCSQIADQSIYKLTTAPIFSAFTLFNAFPTMTNDGTAGLTNHIGSLGMQIAVTHENVYGTASATGLDNGVVWRPTASQQLAGGSMTITQAQGFVSQPSIESVGASSVGHTSIDAFVMDEITVTSHAGTQILGTYRGLYGKNIVNKLAGSLIYVVDCELVAGANNYFLRNTGGAQSDIDGAMFLGNDVDMDGGAGFWFRPPQMTTVQETAMTGAWGAGDAGKHWYNTNLNQGSYWNGAAIVRY